MEDEMGGVCCIWGRI